MDAGNALRGVKGTGGPELGRTPFRHRIRVRYGETDQMGVAHHANFLLYLEDARTAYLRARSLPYGQLEKRGIGLPVRTANLRYRVPALYEDEIDVAVWIDTARSASMTFGYRITRDDQAGETTIATATVELACVDLETMRPRVFPSDLKAFLKAETAGD